MSKLAGLVIDQTVQLSRARDEVHAWRELLEQALALLAERDRELKSARAMIRHQREEIRSIIGGRTKSDQSEHAA